MARKKKEELVEEVTMISEDEGTLIEEVQEDVVEEAAETLIEEVQEVIEDVVEDIQEAVEEVQEAVEDVVEFFGKVFNKVDPATGPLPRTEEVQVIEAAPIANNKEHFDAGVQGKKAKALAMTSQEIAQAAVLAEAKIGGSLDEVKDQTFVETAVGGLIGTSKEEMRNGMVFYRGQ